MVCFVAHECLHVYRSMGMKRINLRLLHVSLFLFKLINFVTLHVSLYLFKLLGCQKKILSCVHLPEMKIINIFSNQHYKIHSIVPSFHQVNTTVYTSLIEESQKVC